MSETEAAAAEDQKPAEAEAAPQAADPDAWKAEPDPRKQITMVLRGPIAKRFAEIIPTLQTSEDVYKQVMHTPELLSACLQVFMKRRDLFKDFLVDQAGNAVTDDNSPLVCQRNVTEIIGMVVRTGMRNFAEFYFDEPINPKKGKPVKRGQKQEMRNLSFWKLLDINKVSALFKKNYGKERALGKEETSSGRFYNSIRDHLDFDWQIQFFPLYVEIPSHVFEKLGTGITRMDTEERLLQLAHLAMQDINAAEQVIKNPELIREMLDNNVLASGAVSQMSKAGFEEIHSALSNVEGMDAKKKWDIFANKETAVMLSEDKRISSKDIEALAHYLDFLNEVALDAMLELNLTRDEMQMFLRTAEENLGKDVFTSLFGPQSNIIPDDDAEMEKFKKQRRFVENSLRALITAIKQLNDQMGGGGDSVEECLATVCRVRRPDLEREYKAIQSMKGAASKAIKGV